MVHTGFLKKTLGVKPQTSTLAVCGECGRFPLELRQKELALKYWCRLLKLPIDNPLHIVYKKLIQHHTFYRIWCSVVFDILRSLGSDNLLEAQADLNVADIDRFNSKSKLSLQNSHADCWRNEIQNINKSTRGSGHFHFFTFRSECGCNRPGQAFPRDHYCNFQNVTLPF